MRDKRLELVLGAVAGALAICAIICLTAGCTALPSHSGWHPKDKDEMRQLIGQTVLDERNDPCH
jgi:hypothetical protein